MSESASSQEEFRGENRLLGKHKWRGKIFSADGRFGRAADNFESTDNDIAKFLNTAGTRPEAGPQSTPLASHIDVAADSRRPSAASVNPVYIIAGAYRRPKPRQNKGLCVRFDSAAPAVIGLGGDEAELPSRDVSRSFADSLRSARSPSREPLHYNTNDQCFQAYGRSTDSDDGTSIQPSSLERRSTGIDNELLAEESYHAGHDPEAVRSAFSGTRRLSPQPRNEEQDLDLNSQKRDVMSLSYRPSSAKEDLSYDESCTWQKAESRSQGDLVAPPSEYLAANFLTPRESPEPVYVSKIASSSSHYFPPTSKYLSKLPDPGQHSVPPDSQDLSQSPKDNAPSLRSAAKSPREESLDDFDSRVRRFNDLFRLNASAHVDVMAMSFERWVTVSAWWFLRGRGELESAMRRKSYVSLAKAWWVLKDITPNLPEIRRFGNVSMSSMVSVIRSLGNQPLAELVEVHLGLVSGLSAVTLSMTRNGMLPPDDIQLHKSESRIFLETPTIPSDVTALTVNNCLNSTIKGKSYAADPYFPILVEDTSRLFSFDNMFVDVCLDFRDEAKPGIHIPCIVSVLRERTDWAVKAVVASQDGQVNLVIKAGEHGGLHWPDVQWIIPLHTMQLRLAKGISLQIKFSQKDFKTIWGIFHYTERIRKEYSASTDEEILYERKLPAFQCLGSPSFPVEPIKDCRVRLFKRKIAAIEGSDQDGTHNGYRFIVITPPSAKTLSKVNHHQGKDNLIIFGTHRSKNWSILLIRLPSSLRVSLTFHEASDVELFRSTLADTSITEEDQCSASLQLLNLTISSTSPGQDMAFMNASRCIGDLRWHKLRVVLRGPPTCHDSQSTMHLKKIRILAECDSGTFTDRIHAGTGELQLNLGVENLNEIKLLRAAQQDMTWSFADDVLSEADLSSLSNMLHSMGLSPSVRTYHFRSLPDLHSFQAVLTGFHVLYDGLASTFSISRRGMLMYKRWETSTPRLQIIKQDKTVQLVAFFKDFSHGTCMNFVLKVTDFFDTFARSGTFFLRIVDAKFALPKGESDPARDFVCLDMPEYPSEHDDIIIGFDHEQGKHLGRLIGFGAKLAGLTKLQREIALHKHYRHPSTKCLEWRL